MTRLPPAEPSCRIVVSNDHEGSCRRALERMATALDDRPADGTPSVVLSGGGAPRRLFRLLAEQAGALPWPELAVYWSDERCVPPDDPESNYGMAADLLLDHVPIRPARVHRMRGELGPDQGARVYRETLAGTFGELEPPDFDVVLLGLGRDGHTCSLFPRAPTLKSRRWAEGARSPEGVAERITLTPAALAGARVVLFLVSGREKAAAVARALEGNGDDDAQPARAIRPAGEVVWLLDRPAAAMLERHPSGRV